MGLCKICGTEISEYDGVCVACLDEQEMRTPNWSVEDRPDFDLGTPLTSREIDNFAFDEFARRESQ